MSLAERSHYVMLRRIDDFPEEYKECRRHAIR
jgi:hypothetical protein